MTFGLKPYAPGPSGAPIVPTAGLVASDLSSSRKIDGVTKQYVTNAQGGFEPMDDIGQRVMLAVAFAEIDMPIIDDLSLATQRDRIISALKPETQGREPRIILDSVTVARTVTGTVTGTVEKTVVYHKTGADTSQTVKTS